MLTLGPPEAEEQLRDAMAIGADRGILLETDGADWDPQATARAIAERDPGAGGSFDLLLFGNEAADSGDYQVAVRVAHALGTPCVTGVKALEVRDGGVVARREAAGGWEVFELPLPAIVRSGRASTCRGSRRSRAGCGRRTSPSSRSRQARGRWPGDGAVEAARGFGQAGGGPRPRSRGGPAGRRGAAFAGDGLVILTLVEHDRGALNELSLEALDVRPSARASGSACRSTRCSIGEQARPIADDLSAFGVAVVHLAVHDELSDYAPEAWARSVVELANALRPNAVARLGERSGRRGDGLRRRAPGRAARRELHRGRGRRAGRCWTVTRQRWGGSLLEEARVTAPVKLLTIAPHALLAGAHGRAAAGGDLDVHALARERPMSRFA